MPIRGLLDVQEPAFDPEDITAITAAHEMALKRLGVTDRTSAMAFLIAKTVIEIATGGERDSKRLSERVIQVLRSRPQ
jgi:aryl-alcohol dehydrogenase-like predicted oxidoreductase